MNWTYSIAFDVAKLDLLSQAEQLCDRLDRAVARLNGHAAAATASLDRMTTRTAGGAAQADSAIDFLRTSVAQVGKAATTTDSQVSKMGRSAQTAATGAARAADNLHDAVDEVGDSAHVAGDKLDDMSRRGTGGFGNMLSMAKRFLLTAGLAATTIGSITAAAQFDAQNIAIDFATSGEGAKNIAFVNELTEDLGLNFQASREGFKQFAAATRDTPIEGQATRDIFEGVAMAGGAMRLSADQMKGAYLALGQIQSKGRVQAEELRGQLGERIPGAFKIAADAMGVTQAELNKMLETGQVASEDFLPKFGAQLTKVFGEDAMRVADGPAAAMERWTRAVYELQVAFGTELLPAVTVLLSDYLIPAVTYFGDHIDMFIQMGVVIGTAGLAMKAYAAYTSFAAIATKGATVATWLMNVAWSANPIGRVIMIISALVSGIIYAWHTFEGFRGFIYGMWEVIKVFGRMVYDYMVAPLLSLGKTLVGVLTFDTDMIKEGLQDGINNAQRLMNSPGFTDQIANAFAQGKQKGLASFRADQNEKGTNSHFDSSAQASTKTPEMSGMGNDGTQGTAGLSGITGRGQTKNITINLTSLIQELRIETPTVDMGVDEIEARVQRSLLQVLNSANATQ